MTATLWMDSRPVAILSTTSSPLHMGSNISRRLKDGSNVSVPRPQSVGHYQSFFGEWTYLINFSRNILWDGPVKNGGNV